MSSGHCRQLALKPPHHLGDLESGTDGTKDLKMALDKCAREPIRSLSTVEAFKRFWRECRRRGGRPSGRRRIAAVNGFP